MRKCSKVNRGVKVAGKGDCSKSFGREWKSLNGFRQALNQTLSQKVGTGQFKAETPAPFIFFFFSFLFLIFILFRLLQLSPANATGIKHIDCISCHHFRHFVPKKFRICWSSLPWDTDCILFCKWVPGRLMHPPPKSYNCTFITSWLSTNKASLLLLCCP